MGDIVGNKEAIVQCHYAELAAKSNETVNMEIPYIIWVLASLSSEMARPVSADPDWRGILIFATT